MSKWLDGEILFGIFMILVFMAGAYDLLAPGGLVSIRQDSGIAFALAVILISVTLLSVVVLSPLATKSADNPDASEACTSRAFMTRRAVLIALVGCVYPILFWAVEYIIATTIIGFVAVSLFTGSFGRKQAVIAVSFTAFSYLLFFFCLGITEGDGALITTGLNDKLPTWRRDFFAAF
ncbi:hypothetical protein J7413_17955 [Shimia sp. R10_1]|uniref:hypothetical protein n=1 Tax=Shimia sp. R10_1 TaxID=2821095 RepID=UPI001AD97C58|nr:hypothetical protein [Shimia sp. R10_1]MBO9475438.1 hypothetical protein [Shimia sp. R10_1]